MILSGGITMILGTAILASSTTLAQLLIGRIVTGIVSILPALFCHARRMLRDSAN